MRHHFYTPPRNPVQPAESASVNIRQSNRQRYRKYIIRVQFYLQRNICPRELRSIVFLLITYSHTLFYALIVARPRILCRAKISTIVLYTERVMSANSVSMQRNSCSKRDYLFRGTHRKPARKVFSQTAMALKLWMSGLHLFRHKLQKNSILFRVEVWRSKNHEYNMPKHVYSGKPRNGHKVSLFVLVHYIHKTQYFRCLREESRRQLDFFEPICDLCQDSHGHIT